MTLAHGRACWPVRPLKHLVRPGLSSIRLPTPLFSPKHHPWEGMAPRSDNAVDVGDQAADPAEATNNQTAGHKPETKPARTVVTAVCATTVPPTESVGES